LAEKWVGEMSQDREEIEKFIQALAKRVRAYGEFSYQDFLVEDEDKFFGYFVPQAKLLDRLKAEVEQAKARHDLALAKEKEEKGRKGAASGSLLKQIVSRIIFALNRPLVNRQREFNSTVARALVYLVDAFQLQNDEIRVFYMKFNQLIDRLNETLIKKAQSEDILEARLRDVLREMEELRKSMGR
jgi:Glu-tRNA(Gln) amidotransferase subunit E-like FAD-binding protein